MSNKIPSIKEVLASLNLYQPTKKGNNIFIKCCFHTDKEPSMVVNESKNLFNCLSGCGGGNTIDFLIKYYNINEGNNTLKIAYQKAKELIGFSYENGVVGKVLDKVLTHFDTDNNNIKTILNNCIILKEPNEYLKGRNIHKLYQDTYILNKNIEIDDTTYYGGTLVFPIINKNNEIKSLQFITKQNFKSFLKGGDIKGNYIDFVINDSNLIFLVEGVADAMSLNLAGFNSIACLSLQNQKNVVLKNFDMLYKRGVVFMDNNQKKEAKEFEIAEQISNMLSTYSICSPFNELKDANDILKIQGVDGLKKIVEYDTPNNFLNYLFYLKKEKIIDLFYLTKQDIYVFLLDKTQHFDISKQAIKSLLIEYVNKKNSIFIRGLSDKIINQIINSFINYTLKSASNYTYRPSYNFLEVIRDYDKNYLNIYKNSGLMAKRSHKKGDFILLKEFLLNLCNGVEADYLWFLEFLAFKLQYPEKRLKILIAFTGEEGTGKSPLGRVLKAIFGENCNTDLTNQVMEDKFTETYCNKLIAIIEEVSSNTSTRRDIVAKLKDLSGKDTIIYNAKRIRESDNYPNYTSFIMFSNEEHIAQITDTDTRWSVFRNMKKLTQEFYDNFFKNFDDEVDEFVGFLKKMKLEKDKWIKPIKNKAKIELVEASKHPIEAYIDTLSYNCENEINRVIKTYNKKLNIIDKINNFDGEYLFEKTDKDYYILCNNLFVELIKTNLNIDYKQYKKYYLEAKKNNFFKQEDTFVKKVNSITFRYIKILKTTLNEG